MNIMGIAGYSGSGKTTLVVRLIPELRRRGLTVSTVKHTHHNVAIDEKGSISRRLRDAGAAEVMVRATDHWALMHEHRNDPEPDLDTLAAMMNPVDILLVEGFKQHDHAKIEVHRQATGKLLLCPDDPAIVAVATDTSLDHIALPQFGLNDISAVCDFIVNG